MERNERIYTLEELRELPVGTQVRAKTIAHGNLWVSLGRLFAEGIVPSDMTIAFYSDNGLQRMAFAYKDYGADGGWVAYK